MRVNRKSNEGDMLHIIVHHNMINRIRPYYKNILFDLIDGYLYHILSPIGLYSELMVKKQKSYEKEAFCSKSSTLDRIHNYSTFLEKLKMLFDRTRLSGLTFSRQVVIICK